MYSKHDKFFALGKLSFLLALQTKYIKKWFGTSFFSLYIDDAGEQVKSDQHAAHRCDYKVQTTIELIDFRVV